jgi:hypothetical protein
MTDVFPLPLPTPTPSPLSTQHIAVIRRWQTLALWTDFLRTMSVALRKVEDGVRLDAILEFPCFRFAVHDHLYSAADGVAGLLKAALLEAGH